MAATNRVNMIGAKAKWDISAAGDQRIGALTGVIGSGVDLGKNSLTFGNDKQQTFAGVISGQGGITKIGKGKAILSGTNTFTGNTTIDEGALQIGDGGTGGSLVGDIINNSLLIFNHVDNRVFSGAISGKGSLIKEGKGQLILAGNNTYTGETVVNAGVLKVVGSFPQAKVKINNGAIFQAIGTVGDLNVETGATFTTTNRTVRSTVPSSDSDLNNHLQVVGDVNFAAGSFYDVQLDEQQSDAISVTGQANVSGATLRIQAAPGAYPLEKEYEILTAEKGIKGTFANITSDLVFRTPRLRQNEHSTVLAVPRNEIPFEQLADNQNQKNVAKILDKQEMPTDLKHPLSWLNEDSAHTAFDNLSGAVQASVHSILLANSHTIREVVTTAMHRRKAADNHQSVWGNLLASKSSLKGDSKTEGVDHRTHGLVIGSDIKLGDHWHVGIAGAVGQTFFNTDQAGSSGVIDNYNLALYGGSHLGALAARFGGAYAFHDLNLNLNLDRRIVFPGFSETVKSNYNAGTMQFWGELSYAIPTNAALFEPFFGLAHVSVQSDKFTETAGSSALMGNKDNHHVTFSTLGLRTEVAFDSFDSRVSSRGSLAWRRGWGDLASTKNLAFNDKSTDFFDVVGVPITKDALLVASGIDIKIGKKCMLEVGYTGQFAAKMKDNAISTRIKWFF
ncbi:autotransporter outer membrane beta-barrel domain-containing protein [Candidatus Regiella insecticola]|uniref:autotransporter outer membrane beta-barrel domain-containing protein n=1 Tax=Candidatus Regiella insecticola TaxID=138073 RepID=UPI001145A598|nr:autotransporter domain-containing protein [Candidatus Regiella insecticola]